jgi:hypothetical protein
VADLLGLVGFVVLVSMLRRRHSVMAFGLGWFALLLVPSSGLLILGLGEPMAEHRVYLSAVGLFLAGGCAFSAIWTHSRSRNVAVAGAALFLVALGFQTVVRNWRLVIGCHGFSLAKHFDRTGAATKRLWSTERRS